MRSYMTYLFIALAGALLFFLPIQGEDDTKLCLTMVIRNDEDVIERCLNSVKGVVDCISICDVGSTDSTLVRIQQFMEKTGIPGEIHQGQSKDFAHNRTLAVQAALKTLREFKFSLAHTYLFVLDPDMTLHPTAAFKKSDLEADSYLVVQHSSSTGCYTYGYHLLRSSLQWTNSGPFWGSWNYKGPHQAAKLLTLTINAHDDSDLTAGQRDIKQIEKHLQNDPKDTCALLRLAHLYRAHKRYDMAIEKYKICILQAKSKEEIWFSKYLIGKCYDDMSKWDLAEEWYYKAYEYNPKRAEPLLKLATHYRLSGQNDIAHLFAKRGSTIERAPDQVLFDASPLLDYHMDEELSISGFYTDFKEDGYAAASRLLLKKGVPWNVKTQTYKNILFYVQPLAHSHIVPITFEFPLIKEGSAERFRPMNPSILKTDQGYQVICRTVNYTQKGAAHFNTSDAEGIFRTRNFLIDYDRNLKMLSHQEIIENLPRNRIFNWVQGIEDCRLVTFNNSLWFTCTTSDTNPTGQRQISLCKLSDSARKETRSVEKLIPLIGPDPHRCEKNWLPFVKDGSLCAIYSCHPFTIYKPDLETGACETALLYEPEHDFSGLRGSAAPIEYNGGYLMLVHETIQFEDQSRIYLHRFLFLDKNFIVQQVSKPFTFFHVGVEFCCSMTMDHSEKELVMAVGVEDSQAHLYFVKLETVQALLTPIPLPSL
jgi:tetratricopeptide (TPR) repeat protein